MNKSDLVKAIAADAEITQEQASKLLDAVTTNITQALAGGDTVALVGFGRVISRLRWNLKGKILYIV
jgi:DNA-binding protein HU-beta